jgi:pyridoxal 5'-phosphate synthase pdxT subunit
VPVGPSAEPSEADGPTCGVLALQGDVREHVAALRALGVAVAEVRTPSELAHVDGLVIPGGESTTMSHLILRAGLDEPLAERLAGGMPALGTCAGMILLARDVLDGRPDQISFGVLDATVRRNGYGRQNESFETDLDLVDDPVPLHGVFIRAPVIDDVGPRVEVLARHGGRPVLVRDGHALACSFHPELSGDLRVHARLVDLLRDHARAGEPAHEATR